MKQAWLDNLLKAMGRERLIDSAQHQGLLELEGSPWWLSLLLGAAAWLSALMIGGAFFMPVMLLADGPWGQMLVGVLMLGASVWLFRQSGLFSAQLALAFSLSGQLIVVIALVQGLDLPTYRLSYPALISALLAAALFWMPATALHRMLCALLVLGNTAVLIGAGPALALYGLLLASAAVVGWLARAHWALAGLAQWLRPLLNAATLVALVLMLFGHQSVMEMLWQRLGAGTVHHWLPLFYRLGAGLLLLGVGLWLLRNSGRQRLLLLVPLLLLCLLLNQAPGLLVSAALGLAAWQAGSRLWSVVAPVFALGYLGELYYSLHLSLLDKSLVLVLSGMGLLVLRWLALRWIGRLS
ncbi:DUF4401 domain-containing protein [Pseudomonas jilinensis]|uniref:DUF4401 domain-containing protein n=1 Tax=Pseudomonas jilinensis TaxID=2078689 RepID=A0A396S7C9_9PSED|nr:DUF4401 domain-containing protein [Pseudomonas jilinensis]RHW22061.1 hypothetical protein C2846_06265 [Pseudomonas jilinensis]